MSTTDSARSGATFALLYLVTECRKVGVRLEYRERVVRGQALYQVKQPLIATAALLEVVAKGVKALSDLASIEDEHATSRRKRR